MSTQALTPSHMQWISLKSGCSCTHTHNARACFRLDLQLRLKDLGKIFPYNKVLPEVFADKDCKEHLYK